MKIEPSKFCGWNTPKHILDCVLEVLGAIDLDPCSNEFSIVPAHTKLDEASNGLAAHWQNYNTRGGYPARVFVNPPYDQPTLQATADHIIKQEPAGCEIITLVPSKTDQKWFADCVDAAAAACFIRGRVAFGKEGVFKSGGQFACTMFYFGKDAARFKDVFATIGACI